MTKTKDPVQQYLQRYAEPEARLPMAFDHPYQHSLIVPAFDETATDVKNVWRQLKNPQQTLVILVINGPKGAEAKGFELAAALTGAPWQVQTLPQLVTGHGHPGLLIVDRFSHDRTIAPKSGVGLARKIGADIALALWQRGVISSNWIQMTDADACVPADYCSLAELPDDVVAAVAPFRHEPLPGLAIETLLYEINLLYYPAGLAWAGSRYGYPTVGSTISCRADAYARVRGFPVRATGEDFYLLAKLRKLGLVLPIRGEEITLAGRLSQRVPIGTGQGISAITELAHPEKDYPFEAPACFDILKQFLGWIDQLAALADPQLTRAPGAFAEYARRIGLAEAYEKKLQEKPRIEVLEKHLHDWFDALKTRQFVHHVRDHGLGDNPGAGTVSADMLATAPFLTANNDLQSIRHTLAANVYRHSRQTRYQ